MKKEQKVASKKVVVPRAKYNPDNFGGAKIFLPSGWKVAHKIDSYEVKLLKILKSRLNKMHSTLGEDKQKEAVFNYGIDICIREVDKTIEREVKRKTLYRLK